MATFLQQLSWPWQSLGIGGGDPGHPGRVILRPARSGCGDGDPVHEVCHGEPVPGLVLQVGEQGVVAGIAEIEGGLVDAGEGVVPLGPGLHRDAGESRAAK